MKSLKKHIKRLRSNVIQTCNQQKRSGEAERLMKELNEAYEILSDPEKKARYDRERAEEKRQVEERARQAEQASQTQYTVRQEQSTNQPQKQEEPAEPEDLIGYMGNMAKNAISRKRREQRKIENAYREGYQEAYAEYWRSQGFRVKEPWTWKRVRELLKSVAIFLVVILAIWFFPPTHQFLVATYESNEMLKGVIDFVIQFFQRFFHNLFQ